MQGRTTFDRGTADRIRVLLSQTRNAPRSQQKQLREEIRSLGFFIGDFPPRPASGFTPDDFDALIRDGRISVR